MLFYYTTTINSGSNSVEVPHTEAIARQSCNYPER